MHLFQAAVIVVYVAHPGMAAPPADQQMEWSLADFAPEEEEEPTSPMEIIEDQHRELISQERGTDVADPPKKSQADWSLADVSQEVQHDLGAEIIDNEQFELSDEKRKKHHNHVLVESPEKNAWKTLAMRLQKEKKLLKEKYIPNMQAQVEQIRSNTQFSKETLADLRMEQKRLIANASGVRDHEHKLREGATKWSAMLADCSGSGAQLLIKNQDLQTRVKNLTAVKTRLETKTLNPADITESDLLDPDPNSWKTDSVSSSLGV